MPKAYGYAAGAERAAATFRAIFAGPTNFLDTARIYGDGLAEERIGAALREHRRPARRASVLSTKLDRDPPPAASTRTAARRSLEASLKALGLDRVDVLHLHDPEYVEPLDQVPSPGRRHRRTLPDEGGGALATPSASPPARSAP